MGGDDLREPGADGRGRPAAAARRRRRRSATRWELHARGDRRGHRHAARCARSGTDEVVGEIPARLLTDECPRYARRAARRASASPSSGVLDAPATPTRCSSCSASPNIRSRALDLPALRPPRRLAHGAPARASTRPCCGCGRRYRGLAVSLDGQGRIARLDPRTGGALAVLEAARNVACAGGEPLALTDCLNFGNPEKGEIGWELAEAIEGMARGVRGARHPGRLRQRLALQRDRRPRDPPDAGRRLRRARAGRAPGARRLARGRRGPARGRVAGLARRLGVPGALRRAGRRPARLDLAAEAALVEFLWQAAPRCSLAARRLRGRARGRARGGGDPDRRRRRRSSCPTIRARWFGEGGGQAVLACAPDAVDRLGGVPLRRLGIGRRRRAARLAARRAAEAWSTLMCGVFGIRSAEPRRRAARLLRPASRSSTAARSRPGSPSPTAAG